MRKQLAISALVGGISLAGLSAQSHADAIIYNTGDPATATVALGINELGQLNTSDGNIATNAGATGLSTIIDGEWMDATSPGCLCEGWGVAANGIGAQANEHYGSSGLALGSFSSTASTATSVVTMTSVPSIKVTHEYKPSAATGLFEAVVTIENTGAATATDVRYTRAMDWDIPEDEFNEYVTIAGVETTTELLYSSDNGFVHTNPFASRGDLNSCGESVSFEDCGPDDHGAVFDFGFGDLGAGESKSFSIFYGAASDEALALSYLATVSAELFSLGQESGDPVGGTPATFIFGFSGVGGEVVVSEVPVPAALPLFAIGALGFRLLRKKKAA